MKITDQRRRDLLCAALDPGYGGSYYWCAFDGTEVRKHSNETYITDAILAAVKKGVSIKVVDIENPEKVGVITYEGMKKGEALMQSKHPYHWADIVAGNEDSTTGDVWLQYAIFGEIIYG